MDSLLDKNANRKSVAACESQPVTVEGLRALLNSSPHLEFAGAVQSLEAAGGLVRALSPAVLVLDKAFGLPAVLDHALNLRAGHPELSIVVWGTSMSDAEALRLLQGGVRGILRKSAELACVIACLNSAAAGSTYVEESVLREPAPQSRHARSELTPREQQVMELIEQGLKNREIARELGIRPGTVKIHLKHIFEKTGVRGRYGLALSGLKERGLLTLPETSPLA